MDDIRVVAPAPSKPHALGGRIGGIPAAIGEDVFRPQRIIGETENPKPNESTTPTWGVIDIGKARAMIESHGVRFDGPTRDVSGMVKLATFYDPDGNPWQLSESPQQQP